MIHIIRNKKRQYEVVNIVNGRLLTSSHQGYERRAGAKRNIISQMKSFNCDSILVQDDTNDLSHFSIVLRFFQDGTFNITSTKPKKKYIQSWENKKASTKKKPSFDFKNAKVLKSGRISL